MSELMPLSPKWEANARAAVFHLLRKYTSLTFLDRAVDLYRNFLLAYAQQLEIPSRNQQWLEATYKDCFLQRLVELEQGIDILGRGGDKTFAYAKLIEGGRFSDYLWGIASEHWGISGDPFFEKLGLQHVGWGQMQGDAYRGFVKSILLTRDSLALKYTVGFTFYCPLSFGKRADGGERFLSPGLTSLFFKNVRPRYGPTGRPSVSTPQACPLAREKMSPMKDKLSAARPSFLMASTSLGFSPATSVALATSSKAKKPLNTSPRAPTTSCSPSIPARGLRRPRARALAIAMGRPPLHRRNRTSRRSTLH